MSENQLIFPKEIWSIITRQLIPVDVRSLRCSHKDAVQVHIFSERYRKFGRCFLCGGRMYPKKVRSKNWCNRPVRGSCGCWFHNSCKKTINDGRENLKTHAKECPHFAKIWNEHNSNYWDQIR